LSTKEMSCEQKHPKCVSLNYLIFTKTPADDGEC
jgi:hypothetical protein